MKDSRSIPVARGDELEVTVDALGDGPDGIAHVGGYVVLVPGVLPGERARVRMTSAARKFGRAELLEVIEASPDRAEPGCAHFLACGGCHRRHRHYAAQLGDKQARLARAAKFAIGDATIDVRPTIPAVPPHGHRHKVVLHLRNTRDGGLEGCFHRLRSPELEAVHECPASDPLAWDIATEAIDALCELPHGAWDPDFAPNDLLRSVLVRTTTAGQAHLVIVARQPLVPDLHRILGRLHRAGATTISVNANAGEFSQLLGPRTAIVSGPQRIEEHIGDVRYLVSPTAFFQTSPQGAAHLVRLAEQWLAPGKDDVVADLYCGGGLLTLPLARRARSAFGVERNRESIQDAIAAATANRITNVHFRSDDADAWLAGCRAGRTARPTLVAMDPPRDGLAPGVVRELAALRPRRIAYVSCDPDTLQRDLRELHAAGFTARSITGVDMFPMTSHVEAVACLEAAR